MKTAGGIIIFAFLIPSFVMPAYAGDSGEYFGLTSPAYWKGYYTDTGGILSSPSRWDKRDWISASALLGVTAGLYFLDGDIRDLVRDNRSGFTDDMAAIAKPVGEGTFTLPPLAILYLYGNFKENRRAKRVPLLALESYAVTGLFTQVMKFSFHRHRPGTGDPYNSFDGPGISTDNLSFPSGHSSSAWSVLTVVALEYDDYAVIPPLCYGAATAAALSRMNDDAHWASDAFFGSAMGYLTARAVVAAHRDDDKGVRVIPYSDGEKTGMFLRLVY